MNANPYSSLPHSMQKYITDTVRNNLKSIITPLTRPQQKAISEVCRGLLGSSAPILRHLAQNSELTAKKQGEKYARHLDNTDLTPAIEAVVLRHAVRDVKRYSIIAYDLSDIAKAHARKMEKLRRVFDGSKREPVSGYTFHGIGINQILVRARIHDGDKEFLPQVRRQVLDEIVAALPGRRLPDGSWKPYGVGTFDRGNDDRRLFLYLRSEVNLDFIARLKANRKVVDCKTGVLSKVGELKSGQYEVCLLDDHGHPDQRYRYRLVIADHLSDKEPIRLLTTLPKERFSRHQIVRMYLERWGVENSFKRIKQKFSLERIRVIKEQEFRNLVALTLFCLAMATIVFHRLQQLNTDLIAGLLLYYKQFLRRWSLTCNLDSFLTFLQKNMTPLVFRNHDPPQGQLFLLPERELKKLGSF